MIENPAEFEALKKESLRKVLSKEALERLGRVKLANPVVASQLEVYLFQLNQTGQLREIIDDDKLKNILSVLMPVRKTKIKRK
ncbi:MAG: DNA-binding protein [Candidatus Aenigmatarchaeota archaeon]